MKILKIVTLAKAQSVTKSSVLTNGVTVCNTLSSSHSASVNCHNSLTIIDEEF